MFRVLCAILLALDLGVDGYGYTSYSYSSGSGCSNGKCSSSSRSMSSPSMRSAVNNCGGNCCGGTAMGRSGSCMPSKMATSSYSISSATKPRFVAQMRPARQMISRSFSNKPLSNNFVSWSSWGPKSPVKTASSSSLSSLGQAWGPNCVLCKQPAQNPIRTVIPAVVKPQRRRSGCPLAHTRVGSSCRRSSLLTGPTSGTNETGNCYRESRDKQLEKVDGSWTKLMCCCSIGAAWGTSDNACSADICSAKGPGYYNFEFKQFTSGGVRTEIKCQNNKCETKSTPLTKPVKMVPVRSQVVTHIARPQTPPKSKPSASHTTYVKSIARGSCGKTAAAGRSSPCMRSCGGGGQSPCVVRHSNAQTISRCGSSIQKPCGSRKSPVVATPAPQGAEKPEILDSTAPPPPPRVITTRRPVRPCSKTSRCVSRCGGCNAKVVTPPIKTMPLTTTTISTTTSTTTTTTTTTTEAVELSDYSSSSSDYETDTDNSADSKCGDGACIESPEQAGGDQVNVPPPTDANAAIQENPDAPTSGCGGLECDSPEAEAGIEIEAVVSLDVVPCLAGNAGCSAPNDEKDEQPPAQANRAAPDEDCTGHACVMPEIDVNEAAYEDDAEQDEDFTNEGCVGVDCGDVDDVQDYQPNRDAPEFGCNGGECGSPEAEQALEIELTAQGPCQDDACNMDLVAKLSNEPSNQPNAQMPTEDCVGAEGCGNVEDAIIENSAIEVGCTGTGCVVVKVECDVAAGAMCDPDQVMNENDNEAIIVTDAPTTQLPVVTDLPTTTDLVTAAALRAATEPVTDVATDATTDAATDAQTEAPSQSPDVVYIQSGLSSYDSSTTLSSSSIDSDPNTYDYDVSSDFSDTSSSDIDFVNQDPINEPMDSDGLVELNHITDCGPGYDQTANGECVDIDECYSSNPCNNGHCFNTDGSYECNCQSGFEIKRDSMGSQRCEDINECALNMCGGIGSGANCVNTFGNYDCICEDFTHKFDKTKKQCIAPESSSYIPDYSNWYEAREQGQCFSDVCAGESVGMDTSYTDCCCGSGSQWLLDGEDQCSPCPSEFSNDWDELCASYDSSQFKAQPAEVRREPRDLCHTQEFDHDGLTYEECCCSASVNPIWWGSSNTPCIGEYENGFYQQCPSGAGIASGTPLDECELFGGDNLCPDARCIDTAKRYQCTCDRNGYYWTGEQCENFNECSLPSVYCIGGQCIDTEGSYTCVCPEGKIEGANGRCQPQSMAMAMVKPEATVDFDEDNVCYSSNTCDMSQIQATSTSRTDCCCNGGGAWGSEDACTQCPAVFSLAYEDMCGLPTPIVVKIDEPDAAFSQSDNSNSVAVDEYAVYDDSDSDSIYEMDDNYSSEYDLADQPSRNGQVKPFRLPNNNSHNNNSNDNRATPLSTRVISEKLPSRGSFACGLPGGCGHGDCVKAPRGVTCQCQRGWRKNGQGRCNLH